MAASALVLLADDDAELRSILELALTGIPNTELVCAANAEEALAIAKTRPVTFVLTDFKMDDMTGVDLLLQLRQREVWPVLGAVVMSGEDDDSLSQRAIAAGAREFWRKPVSPAKLRRFVSDLVRGVK